MIERWAGMDEGPHQPRWPAQTREVRERVRPARGGDPESTVQQPVPDLGSDEMVRVAHHLDVIDLAERDVHGQLVEEWCGGVGGIGLGIERMDVADQPSLRMREIGHGRVRQCKTRGGGVGVAGILRQQIVRREAEQPQVAPHAGMKLLRMHEQKGGRRNGVLVGTEVRDIGNPLLLIDDQILDHVQVLGARLKRQMRRRVAVGTTIVHVDVNVARPPSLCWKVGDALESDTLRDSPTRRHVHVGTIDPVFRALPNFHVHLPSRDR